MFVRFSRLGLVAALLAVPTRCKIHVVEVGNGGFKYTPNTTTAAVGDIVQFWFYPPDHSVIRAEFTGSDACGGDCNPCVPYELYHPNTPDHFFSGLVNVSTSEIQDPPKWNLTINDTSPIFFYCNAVDSCHPNGMVGVINPNKSTPLSEQFAAAKSAQYQLNPGESFPAEGSMPTVTGTVVQSPGASATAITTPTASTAASNQKSGLSGGAIAGIVVGCVVGLLLFGAAIYFYGRSRTYGKIFSASQKGGSSAPGGSEAGGPAGVENWVAGQQAQHAQEKHQSQNTQLTDQHVSLLSGPQTPLHSPRPEDVEAATPGGAQFVGYNRQSGAPEYSYEAPSDGHQINELRHEKSKEKVPPVPEETQETTEGRMELPG